jgi:hypothetical protein
MKAVLSFSDLPALLASATFKLWPCAQTWRGGSPWRSTKYNSYKMFGPLSTKKSEARLQPACLPHDVFADPHRVPRASLVTLFLKFRLHGHLMAYAVAPMKKSARTANPQHPLQTVETWYTLTCWHLGLDLLAPPAPMLSVVCPLTKILREIISSRFGGPCIAPVLQWKNLLRRSCWQAALRCDKLDQIDAGDQVLWTVSRNSASPLGYN